MSNEVFEAIRTVLAVREYQDKPIPDDVMRRVVEAAHLTASSMNGQPWQFILIRDKTTLHDLGAIIKTGRYIATSQAAVVVAVEKDNQYAWSDASRAIQDMILTAWAEGVGSNWTGFGSMHEVATRVGAPSGWDVLAVVPFGYPKRKLGMGKKKRKPFGEVVSSERFGQPLSA